MIDHAKLAAKYFVEGYNCAQAVVLAFCDVTGLDEKTALRISSSFGGGMGRLREVCGACAGMFMVAGLLYGYDELDDTRKKAHYQRIQDMAAAFREQHTTIRCSELLQHLSVTKDAAPSPRTAEYYKVRPCVRFVETAAEILDRYIAEHPIA